MDPLLITSLAALASLGLLALSLHFRQRHRLLADTPTSKVQGVFIGLVELKGTAECAAPLTSYLAEARCVHYRWTVAERWSRLVTETVTDKDGKTSTRTRQESGWTTVAQGGETTNFYVRDDTGHLLVRPDGAKLETLDLFSETVSRGDALYYLKGPPGGVANSDGVRRFTEEGIPLHAPLFVVGRARERADVVAPEIAADSDAELFLISTRAEEKVIRGYGAWSWTVWILGLIGAGAAGLPFANSRLDPPIAQIALGVAAYFLVWALCWLWMAYNSLVSLRERVRQAWSLIEVQLKRRHDLIPGLVTTLTALRDHEASVQTAVAALRTQATATAPGVAGPDHHGLAQQLRVVAERYPELKSAPEFRRLADELIATEQRIALARAYYNDIATHFATRLEIVPDRWVAALGRMQAPPLLGAADFERAPVVVDFSRSA